MTLLWLNIEVSFLSGGMFAGKKINYKLINNCYQLVTNHDECAMVGGSYVDIFKK